MNKKICLWSSPRNLSTALMYSFASRNDTKVFDEPLYSHYLKVSKVNHPGRNKIMDTQETNGKKVVEDILLKSHAPVSFHKLMTHFLEGLDHDFLLEVTNILLIRNPSEIIASYHKVIPNPNMQDIGIKMQYELFNKLEKQKKVTAVIDAKEVLKNPENILQQLCDKIEIPFKKEMLRWKKGPKKEDGVWAKYWYKNIHKSTGFLPYTPKKIKLKGSNLKLAHQCIEYYNFLYDKSLKSE